MEFTTRFKFIQIIKWTCDFISLLLIYIWISIWKNNIRSFVCLVLSEAVGRLRSVFGKHIQIVCFTWSGEEHVFRVRNTVLVDGTIFRDIFFLFAGKCSARSLPKRGAVGSTPSHDVQPSNLISRVSKYLCTVRLKECSMTYIAASLVVVNFVTSPLRVTREVCSTSIQHLLLLNSQDCV